MPIAHHFAALLVANSPKDMPLVDRSGTNLLEAVWRQGSKWLHRRRCGVGGLLKAVRGAEDKIDVAQRLITGGSSLIAERARCPAATR
jgi:hypothetical protein